MINFPKPKVPSPQFQGPTRSKDSRILAERRKKVFLAKAARSGLDAVNAALDAPTINPEAREVNAKQVELQEAVLSGEPVPADLLPTYRRVNLGSVSEGQTASVDADGVVTRKTNS